ncbi:hypothetical protein PENANT_c005G00356 [Penicillium antarcticum]|uniref:Zn(2)-C6 fungal-type domain-containing protein n=1 Tax=Penicillium antarcticum TaxID=416450 RepID=A0A1V6QE39_9EURO|nr:hypothetical protein PENANT_c005G00356 [Penicillium antarcticum]
MRSYTGCLTCRGRKLKCDEAKPICGPCNKASRECKFDQRCIFRSQTFSTLKPRHKRRAGSRGNDTSNVLDEGQTWVEVPHDLTFIQIDDPWSPDGAHVLHEPCEDREEETSSVQQHTDPRVNFGLDKQPPKSSTDNSLQSTPIWHTLVPEVIADTPDSVRLSIPRPQRSGKDVDHNVVISYMLRHFKEGPGQWMDLFDTTAYFSSKVPVIAAVRPLLKSAVCALSAKHLQHLYHISDGIDRNSYILSLADEETWHYQSAKHYDQALGYLKTAIDLETYNDSPSEKEEMLAAVAILCLYELMDAPGTSWRAHLSALPLFNETSASMPVHSSVIIPRTAIKGPIFWSLARQDLLCAFISETSTRLDLKDMRLWQNAGLITNEHGTLLPSTAISPLDVQNYSGIEEDMKANELTWLLGKIANHLIMGDTVTLEDFVLPREQRAYLGLNQQHLLDRWNLLMSELEQWYDCLPLTFTEAARTRAEGSTDPRHKLSLEAFEQIWFNLPLCAATIQSYHQARILLLVNQPQQSTAIQSTVSSRLRAYRSALKQALFHAREICGINLANPTDPVRINSVQALFVAGQVFQGRREQDAVLEILAGIERDLGWTTQFHAAKLVDEWGRGGDDSHGLGRGGRGYRDDWMTP